MLRSARCSRRRGCSRPRDAPAARSPWLCPFPMGSRWGKLRSARLQLLSARLHLLSARLQLLLQPQLGVRRAGLMLQTSLTSPPSTNQLLRGWRATERGSGRAATTPFQIAKASVEREKWHQQGQTHQGRDSGAPAQTPALPGEPAPGISTAPG